MIPTIMCNDNMFVVYFFSLVHMQIQLITIRLVGEIELDLRLIGTIRTAARRKQMRCRRFRFGRRCIAIAGLALLTRDIAANLRTVFAVFLPKPGAKVSILYRV